MTCFLLFYLVIGPILKVSISQHFGPHYILRESLERGDNEYEVRFSKKKMVVKIFEKRMSSQDMMSLLADEGWLTDGADQI